MKPGNSKEPKNIQTRLSFSGWVYVLLSLLVGLAAVNSNNNVLFLITSLLLGLLFLSGLTALYNISGLSVRASGKGVFTALKPGLVMISVDNKKRFSSLVLDVSLGDNTTLISVIPPKKQKDVFLTWTPPHRGTPLLPQVKLTSSFPFGFVRRGGFFDSGTRLIAAPEPAGHIPQPPTARDEEQMLPGGPEQGRGEWKGIRQYRPGEGKASIVWRRIDWQKPAMGSGSGQWPAHSFARERSRSLVLDWDDPLYAGLDTEKRLSLIRSALDKVMLENNIWELKLPGKNISGKGRVNYEPALLALALIKPLPGPLS